MSEGAVQTHGMRLAHHVGERKPNEREGIL